MRALILSTSSKNIKQWCQKAPEAAYTRNISYHRAIKMTPYEAVYGIKSHREVYTSKNSEADHQEAQDETHPDLSVDDDLRECEDEEERPKKRQKLSQNQ